MTALTLNGAVQTHARKTPSPAPANPMLEELLRPAGEKSIPTRLIYELERTALAEDERAYFEEDLGYAFLENGDMPSGATLFSRIVADPDYYVDRAELSILSQDDAPLLHDGQVVTEFGPGDGHKTAFYLENSGARGITYQAVDVSQGFLDMTADRLRKGPCLSREPRLCCDDFSAAASRLQPADVLLFLGTTISNFEPSEAAALLHYIHDRCLNENGVLLIGQDGNQDEATLQNCYDDRRKHTAAFVLNGLRQLRREAAPLLNLHNFGYKAQFDAAAHVMRMGIESRIDQTVRLGGNMIVFERGEFIQVGQSYKYPGAIIGRMAQKAGFACEGLTSSREGVNLHKLRKGPRHG